MAKEDGSHRLDKTLTECLVLAQAFETCWVNYFHSGGVYYDYEARETARKLLDSYSQLCSIDEAIKGVVAQAVAGTNRTSDVPQELQHWASSRRAYPFDDRASSRYWVFAFTNAIKHHIWMRLQLDPTRLPLELLDKRDLELPLGHGDAGFHLGVTAPPTGGASWLADNMERASDQQTIVVVGDIRRSQDLMTYGPNPAVFVKKMHEFVNESMNLVGKHKGTWGKFTGDGFIVYFNPVFSGAETGQENDFIEFLRAQMDFARDHLGAWVREIRKVPSEGIGFAMGADIGKLEFQKIGEASDAVGEAIVWAQRMASEAKVDEIILNNLLAVAVEGRGDLRLRERQGKTKAGESFRAWSLTFPAAPS